jgi:hypothetical protein
MARQAGLAPHHFLHQLHLPRVVDGIAPDGQLPEAAAALEGIAEPRFSIPGSGLELTKRTLMSLARCGIRPSRLRSQACRS